MSTIKNSKNEKMFFLKMASSDKKKMPKNVKTF